MLFKDSKLYDVFISFAVEDRSITDELYTNLTNLGLKVWYSKFELGLGGNISTAIEKGLKQSRYGVPILSNHYIGKWPAYELQTMLAQHYQDKQPILPILHQITHQEVVHHYPDLAPMYAISTDRGILYAAEQIKKQVRGQDNMSIGLSFITRKKGAFLFFLMVFISALLSYLYILPKDESIHTKKETPIIEKRTPVIERDRDEGTNTQTVYVTQTGHKYHTRSCSFVEQSCIPVLLNKAVRSGYTPCSRCRPPEYEGEISDLHK